jgi:hypothetical protein
MGSVVLLLVMAAFCTAAVKACQRNDDARARAIWILTGTSLFYGAFTAIGRLPVNLEAAFMWRYTTLMIPGMCGLVLAIEQWFEGRSRQFALVGWAAACALIWGNFTPERYAWATAETKKEWIASYLRTRDLAAANDESKFWVYMPAPNSPRIKLRLKYLEEHRFSFFREKD